MPGSIPTYLPDLLVVRWKERVEQRYSVGPMVRLLPALLYHGDPEPGQHGWGAR